MHEHNNNNGFISTGTHTKTTNLQIVTFEEIVTFRNYYRTLNFIITFAIWLQTFPNSFDCVHACVQNDNRVFNVVVFCLQVALAMYRRNACTVLYRTVLSRNCYAESYSFNTSYTNSYLFVCTNSYLFVHKYAVYAN